MTAKPSYLSLTDLFCGAGGASIGAEVAGLKLVLGVSEDGGARGGTVRVLSRGKGA